MASYKRSLEELRQNAVLHWPDAILNSASDLSVLPLLLKTQDSFISILKVANKSPLAWKSALELSNGISGPVFLKHLMVLSDLGGEALNKLPPLVSYFPDGVLLYDWAGKSFKYVFKEIQADCSLANSSLKVNSKKLLAGGNFTPKMLDVAMLLLFGSSATNDSLPSEVKDKCVVGSLIGHPDELERFVKENYIRVSRQVGGATSNALGQEAQKYVAGHLTQSLPKDWIVKLDSTLDGVSHTTDGGETNFDVVAISPTHRQFGIEVSFQVTTNSVIERKARESASLMRSVHEAGHKICYVVDGAGNINIRKNAVSIICGNSDCTVAMCEAEIKHLAEYLKETERSN